MSTKGPNPIVTLLTNPTIWILVAVVVGVIMIMRSQLFKDLEGSLDQFSRMLTAGMKLVEDMLNDLNNPIVFGVIAGIGVLLLAGFIGYKAYSAYKGKQNITDKQQTQEAADDVKEAGGTVDDAKLKALYDEDTPEGRQAIADDAANAVKAEEAAQSGKLSETQASDLRTAQEKSEKSLDTALEAVDDNAADAEEEVDDAIDDQADADAANETAADTAVADE